MLETRKRSDERSEPRSRKLLRQWLNGIFLLGAVVGMLVYFFKDDTLGTYIILAAMVPKMAEASMRLFTTWCVLLLFVLSVQAQSYGQNDGFGTLSGTGDSRTGNFNPHNNDTTQQKQVPRGLYVWTVDRRFGDVSRTEPDTLPHLFQRSVFGNGVRGEYNTVGNNFSPRLSRVFADRPETSPFLFTQVYDQVLTEPDRWHFTNTLSPLTNLSYNNCGDKTNGEDHLDARFAVNAGKRTGGGFDVNYAYARGYFQNQSTSHFGTTFYISHIGDRYQLHALASLWHQKQAENGGVASDDYLRHPELYSESFSSNEIPVVLSRQWNKTDHQHLFLSHRYNVGFYRKVPMTPEEIAARKFAKESAKEKQQAKGGAEEDGEQPGGRGGSDVSERPAGRPEGARIAKPAGKTPAADTLIARLDSLSPQQRDSLLIAQLTADSTRISVTDKAQQDSLNALQARQDSIDATMKDEYVPVTSFIHTLELGNHKRQNLAYSEPSGYFQHSFYDAGEDPINDKTTLLQVKNTVAIALLEGFNKYAKAGLKVFATHDLQQYHMNDLAADSSQVWQRWTEHRLSIGAQIIKTQGRTLHYNLTAETWLAGEGAGQLKIDFGTDLNFPALGDTVRLAAKAHLYHLHPVFYQRHYHSRHLWWDQDLDKETRVGAEGLFTLEKTHTRLRIAVDQLKHYTYLGMSYTVDGEKRNNLTATMRQGNDLNVLTVQLSQDLALGPMHWDNTLTYQNSSDKEVLPLPTLNVFSNLYLKFRIARVLDCELGACATYFTEYDAPDYVPQLALFAVQEQQESRVRLGNYPFVDVYANFHLKQARFFILMGNVLDGKLNRMAFLAPHYPTNGSVLRFGVSWNFYN